jgi:hypothetical protein
LGNISTSVQGGRQCPSGLEQGKAANAGRSRDLFVAICVRVFNPSGARRILGDARKKTEEN